MAKNKMRRCLAAILDPHPSGAEVEELWDYFQSSCAYCGIPLAHISVWIGRSGRESLDPSAKAQAEIIISQALESFDEAVKKLRALRT
jgi:hypothetical protein